MNDFFLLLMLKVRHVRTALDFLVGGIIGSSFTDDTDLADRSYRVYCVVVVGACSILMWLALLNFVAELFLYIGAANTILIFQTALFVFPAVFLGTAVHFLRTCPIRQSVALLPL